MGKLRGGGLAAVMAAVVCGTPHARAVERFWADFVNGNFNDTTKWTAGAVPGSGDGANFNVLGNGAPYSVTFPGHTIVQGTANYLSDRLTIGRNTVTFLQSSQLNLTQSTYTLGTGMYVGEGNGVSVLTSRLSMLSTPVASIGHLSGSAATVNINAGSFNVTGSGTDFELKVGDAATGTLNINGGTQLNVTGEAVDGENGAAAVGVSAGVSGTVNISAGVWNNTSNDTRSEVIIGDFGNGAVNLSAGGGMNNYNCEIGARLGSVGTVTVGANSIWYNRNGLDVGNFGSGTLNVLDGGNVTCAFSAVSESGGNGMVLVSGTGSRWTQDLNLAIGSNSTTATNGTALMMISNGGTVWTGAGSTNHAGYVGSFGSGTVTVTGFTSNWTIVGDLVVNVLGTVNIADSGRVSSVTGEIDGTLKMTGGGILVTNVLQINQPNDTTSINVQSGGKVSNGVTIIANTSPGYVATVNLDGAGSTWDTTNQLYVGFSWAGAFNVTNGAKVTADQTQLGTGINGSGAVVVDGAGSTWTTANSMDVGVVGIGSLNISNGGVVTVNGPFTIGAKGKVEGDSTIVANVKNGGTVAPGDSVSIGGHDPYATLRINGSYTQTASGTLQLELPSTTTHDLLSISGDATLAGALKLDTTGGTGAIPGDRYTVLTAAHCTGIFAAVNVTNPTPVQMVPIYSPTGVAIFAAGVGEKTWGTDADGNSSVSENWIGGTPGAIDDKVAFSTVITSPRTVSVDNSFTAGSIYFDGSNSYLIQGPGVITLDVSGSNSASLVVKNLHGTATHTISAQLSLKHNTTIDVAASGVLRITQPMSAAEGIAITKTGVGTLAVKNVRADGLVMAGGTVQIMPGGGAAGTSIVKAVTIASTAALDLNNNDLLIDYAAPANPYGTIRGYILSGFNSGTTGIISTSGQAAHNTTLALVDNAQLHRTVWNGLQIDDTTIIVKDVLRGDANLDGSVGFADLVAVAQHYGNNSGQASWDIGDFNYDGNVGFADLVAVAQNYGTALPAAIPGVSDGFARDEAAAFRSVPEPSWMALAYFTLALGMRRRRFKA